MNPSFSKDLACLPTNTLAGKYVTPDNLDEFVTPLPQELKEKIDTFVQSHQGFWSTLVEQTLPHDLLTKVAILALSALRTITGNDSWDVHIIKQLYITWFLYWHSIENLSHGSNIITSVAQTNYIMRMSSARTRALLQRLAGADYAHTYQNASIIFHCMRMQEFLEHNPETPVLVAPEIYAYCDPSGLLDDSHCAVIVRKACGFQSVTERIAQGLWKDDLDALFPVDKPERLEKTVQLFCYAGLFDGSAKNILYNPQENKLVYLDYEQPNTTLPGQEFNQEKINRPLHNIMAFLVGHEAFKIRGFLHSLRSNKRVHDQALTYIGSDPIICAYYLYNQYINSII